MNKSIKKTMATVLMSALIILTATLAMASPGDYYFTTGGDGVAEPRSPGMGSDNCVRLWIPGNGDIDDDGKVRMYYSGNLGTLEEVTYWSYVVGYSGELHPYVVLDIDTDTDDVADMWVVQWEVESYPPTGENTWIQTTFDDSSRIHVPGLAGFGQQDAKTLGDLKAESGWTDYEVLEVKLMIGMWAITEPLEAFIDDVTVNDLLYDFEPKSSTSLESTVRDPIISIMVDPTNIDFGVIVRGQNSDTVPVTVTNIGEVSVDVTTEIVGPDKSFYDLYLYTNGDLANVWTATIDVDLDANLDLTLKPPIDAPVGTFDATLIFWAEETP